MPRPSRDSAVGRPSASSLDPVSAGTATALGLCLGAALDRLAGDPQRGHPVALFGSAASALERRLYAPTRTAGAVHLAASLVIVGLPAALLQHRGGGHWRVLAVGVGTWTVLGGRSLGRAATLVGDAATADDLSSAREALPSLCGRNPA